MMSLFYKLLGVELALKESIEKNLELIVNERNSVFDELNFDKKPDFSIASDENITNFLSKKIYRHELRLSSVKLEVQRLAEGQIRILVAGVAQGEEVFFVLPFLY